MKVCTKGKLPDVARWLSEEAYAGSESPGHNHEHHDHNHDHPDPHDRAHAHTIMMSTGMTTTFAPSALPSSSCGYQKHRTY